MRTDYPTGPEDGMSFISNRWVFTGPQGYRVKPRVDGTGFLVVSYTAAREMPVYSGTEPLTEDGAHELAASLSRR